VLDTTGLVAYSPAVMVAILEMPEIRRRVSRLSVEEYHRLEKRVVGPEATLVSASVPGIEIRVADLFA
jgi:hypothetical protein